MKVRVFQVPELPKISSGISATRNSRTKFGFRIIRVQVFRVQISGYRFFAQPYAHSFEALTAIRVLLACQFTSANAYYIELASIE